MKIGVPKETFPGERRVAISPSSLASLTKSGIEVMVETGAGDQAGFPDSAYASKGAAIASKRSEVFAADAIVQVRAAGENLAKGEDDLQWMRPGQWIIASCDALSNRKASEAIANTGATLFALELIPRITRAQSMDILSSQARSWLPRRSHGCHGTEPHPAVDTDSLQDWIQITGYLRFMNATTLPTGPVKQLQIFV